MTQSDTQRIAELNDICRKGWGATGGQWFVTQGIEALHPIQKMHILAKVVNFEDFTKDNNPYGERDFGAFTHQGNKIFWKIDYYDPSLQWGSENPADPKQTKRVLTIMLASEY